MIIVIIIFKWTRRMTKSTLLPEKSFAEQIYEKKMRRRKLGADRFKMGKRSQESISTTKRMKF